MRKMRSVPKPVEREGLEREGLEREGLEREGLVRENENAVVAFAVPKVQRVARVIPLRAAMTTLLPVRTIKVMIEWWLLDVPLQPWHS
jgi:hypothetical protein